MTTTTRLDTGTPTAPSGPVPACRPTRPPRRHDRRRVAALAVTDVTADLLAGPLVGARSRGDTGLLAHGLDPAGEVVERTVCLDRLPGAPRRIVGRLAAWLGTTAPPQDPRRRNLVVVEGERDGVSVVATFGISPSGHGRVTLAVRSGPVGPAPGPDAPRRLRPPTGAPRAGGDVATPPRATPHPDRWAEISRRHAGRRHGSRR